MKRKKSITSLPAALDKKLVAYIAAAGAVSVASLGTPESAEAKVVFTQTYKVIDWGARMGLDLNNDGIADFNFGYFGTFHGGQNLIHAVGSNRVIASSVEYLAGPGASAMPAGATVGPGAKFVGYDAVMEGESFFSSLDYFGPWLHAHNKFLGLEVTINGQHHFGWARISFPSFGRGILTGYAYETVAGKAIVTGATSGHAEVSDATSPAGPSAWRGKPSLGLLARGAVGLDLWRRDESIVESIV
jgi:hypothetical protein